MRIGKSVAQFIEGSDSDSDSDSDPDPDPGRDESRNWERMFIIGSTKNRKSMV